MMNVLTKMTNIRPNKLPPLYPSKDATTPEEMADDIMYLIAAYTRHAFDRDPDEATDDAPYRALFATLGELAWQTFERTPDIHAVSWALYHRAEKVRKEAGL